MFVPLARRISLIYMELQRNHFPGEATNSNDGNLPEYCKFWHWRVFKYQHKQNSQYRKSLFHK